MVDTIERLRSTLAERYRIERELAHGGMATVFLAKDLKHHRQVAIKVLDPELAAAIGPDRFLREIEIAARLQHPHILPLYDSGVAPGLLYFVMPYVQGESLRDRLVREKQLPLGDAIQIAREVAIALEFAHGHKVVHRDIKPENILLSGGQAVVADFGIARVISATGEQPLTRPGLMIGTPAYMSPEQALGSDELDGRSDIYSLACVLHEMLAGQPPFTGPTEDSIVHQHLAVEPPAVTAVQPAVPARVAQALRRALAKTPADRFTTAARFAEALATALAGETTAVPKPGRRPRWLVVSAAAMVIASVTLAALTNRGAISKLFHRDAPAPPMAKKNWILVAAFDGPADDPTLAVAARDLIGAALDQSEIVATIPQDQVKEALRLAGKADTTRLETELARELAYRSSVRAVLEGSIRRLGKGFSIVLRVADVDSGRIVLTASAVARTEEALIPTLGRLAKRLREGLGERGSAIRATRSLIRLATPSFDAYRKVERGYELYDDRDFANAVALCREALALDPDFAGAWGLVAVSFMALGQPDSAETALNEALRRPQRLSGLDPFDWQAELAELKGDLPAAIAIYDRALRLYPTHPDAAALHSNRGVALMSLERYEEAVESFKLASDLLAFGPVQVLLDNQFSALLALERFDEARRVAEQLQGHSRQFALLRLAHDRNDWAAAESLATRLKNDASAPELLRFIAALSAATGLAARGAVRAADAALEQTDPLGAAAGIGGSSLLGRTMLAEVAGTKVPLAREMPHRGAPTSALIILAYGAAVAGDTVAAGRVFRELQSRPPTELSQHGAAAAFIEAWIAARSAHWGEVLQLLRAVALTGDDIDPSRPIRIRGAAAQRLVAEAYDRLGHPDSAAAYFERSLQRRPPWSPAQKLTHSFIHRRLVLLYTRMGRLEDARRHWEIFSKDFSRPDPELKPLLEEARAALASAKAMAASAKR